ncbi:MAG: hypothetical protein ABW123_29345, partial [Cystobacter sp.]
ILPLLAVLSACDKSTSGQAPPSFLDCQEDFGCFISRAATCAPSSVLVRREVQVSGKTVRTVTRHEWVSRIPGGRCHLRITRVEPPAPPVREPQDPYAWDAAPVVEDTPEQKALDERSPPRLQCLYSAAQATSVLRRLKDGHATAEDLEPCYPGDGRCFTTPLLRPGCVSGECLLGRWTYTCEAPDGQDIFQCEGTRLADSSPREKGCWSFCGPDGREQIDCREEPTRPKTPGTQDGEGKGSRLRGRLQKTVFP